MVKEWKRFYLTICAISLILATFASCTKKASTATLLLEIIFQNISDFIDVKQAVVLENVKTAPDKIYNTIFDIPVKIEYKAKECKNDGMERVFFVNGKFVYTHKENKYIHIAITNTISKQRINRKVSVDTFKAVKVLKNGNFLIPKLIHRSSSDKLSYYDFYVGLYNLEIKKIYDDIFIGNICISGYIPCILPMFDTYYDEGSEILYIAWRPSEMSRYFRSKKDGYSEWFISGIDIKSGKITIPPTYIFNALKFISNPANDRMREILESNAFFLDQYGYKIAISVLYENGKKLISANLNSNKTIKTKSLIYPEIDIQMPQGENIKYINFFNDDVFSFLQAPISKDKGIIKIHDFQIDKRPFSGYMMLVSFTVSYGEFDKSLPIMYRILREYNELGEPIGKPKLVNFSRVKWINSESWQEETDCSIVVHSE